jgi:hypothetical protein
VHTAYLSIAQEQCKDVVFMGMPSLDDQRQIRWQGAIVN